MPRPSITRAFAINRRSASAASALVIPKWARIASFPIAAATSIESRTACTWSAFSWARLFALRPPFPPEPPEDPPSSPQEAAQKAIETANAVAIRVFVVFIDFSFLELLRASRSRSP